MGMNGLIRKSPIKNCSLLKKKWLCIFVVNSSIFKLQKLLPAKANCSLYVPGLYIPQSWGEVCCLKQFMTKYRPFIKISLLFIIILLVSFLFIRAHLYQAKTFLEMLVLSLHRS